MSFESEYENVNPSVNEDLGVGKLSITPQANKSAALQQAPPSSAQRKRYKWIEKNVYEVKLGLTIRKIL